MKHLLPTLLLVACASVESKDPEPTDRLSEVREKVDSLTVELLEMEDEHGWIATGCDAMLWEGKARAVIGGGALQAAEREPGRYGRRPDPCWDGKDLGSPTTWSRDMGIGLLYWAWRNKDLRALLDHEKYGRENSWVMGEPLADGRAVYTPNMIGTLYEVIHVLGGPSNTNRHWPNSYSSGLSDFEAHLLVLRIALRGEVAESDLDKPRSEDTAFENDLGLLSISGTMFKRLEEQAEREPGNALFQAVLGHYSGDMDPAIDACLSDYQAEYVRCEGGSCELIEKLFACDYILRVYDDRWVK